MPTVGERVRRRRQELGWSQDLLARKAGISKGFLSDLETGKRRIGADTLLDLGRALGLSLDYLMTGQDSEDHRTDEEIPTSLARFADAQGLSVRETMTLLGIQKWIIASRRGRKAKLEKVDWKAFYGLVKKFL
jgi:transcriptional regulator with XRE-family HTH domain